MRWLFLTHYAWFICTVDPESYLETSCTSVIVTAMQVEKKKGKIPTSETYLSKDSRQTTSKAMLSQMCQWISMLSLCEAFIGLQCRRQHFCLIFSAIILALPYINPLCCFQLDKRHATIVLWLMPFSTSPSLQWWKGSQVNVQLHGQLFWLPLPDRVVDFFVFVFFFIIFFGTIACMRIFLL